MSPLSSPQAPGRLGERSQPQAMLAYLGQLDAWISGRRNELNALDSQVLNSPAKAELTPDIALSMALWKAVKDRYDLLLATWDSGRVGPAELDRLSSLIWGRLDTGGSKDAQLQNMAVSLPEACRLSDALVAQLRTRLQVDPAVEQYSARLRDLRAQAERIRDQVKLEPPANQAEAGRRRDEIAARVEELVDKLGRGGDIGGLLAPLEIEAAKFERDLIVGSAQRRENRDRLEQARELTGDLQVRSEALQNLVERVLKAVSPAPKYAVPNVSALGPIPNTRAELDRYLSRLAQVGRAMDVIQDAYSLALAERDQVAAGLAALHAKAEALGYADDAELTELGGLVDSFLEREPIPMPVVRQLVGAYQAYLDWLDGSRS